MRVRQPEYGATIIGPQVIDAAPHEDERGAFARFYCPDAFATLGLPFTPVQMSLSRNHACHTLRGMHDQPGDMAEGKVVRVTRGAIYDVAVDVRPESPTRGQWCATELSADAMNAFFIPRGFLHGFLTLEAETDVLYQIDRMFEPGHGRGFRWNDPAFAIDWPHAPAMISERDATYPDFSS